MKKVKGTIHYQSIEMGFWSIVDEKGGKWRPVDLPAKLQQEGLKGQFELKPLKGEMSMIMWGTAAKLVSYTLD